MHLFNMIFCAAAYILNRLLLQTKEPTEAAKVKMPTGKTVRQRLDSWWAELEPQCYYFEDDFCDNSHMYLVLGSRDKPIIIPKGITINDDPKGAWASLSVACDHSILPAIEGIDSRMKDLLAENSEASLGMKCTTGDTQSEFSLSFC